MLPNSKESLQIQKRIAEMLGQNDGNPYLSPHGHGYIMPQVENSSYMPPQGHVAHPIQNLANLTSGISGMNYEHNNVGTSNVTYDPEDDYSEEDSEQEDDLKKQNNGNVVTNDFQPNSNKNSTLNWNKSGMSDDDNNRNDETDYDEIDDDESDDDEDELRNNRAQTTPRNTTRRRLDMYRRVLDVQSFQIQNREFEKSVSIENTPKSTYKKSKSALRRLGSRNSFSISKLSLLFRRNKKQNETTTASTNTSSPDLRNSITLPISTQSVEDAESKSDDTNKSPVEIIQKDIASLYFRSIFPEHFLTIRLFQLNVEEIQNIIRQIDHFKSVEDKLNALVFEESLSGAALMCCNLTELKKILDLNLGNWTIFEQLITGLRHVQNDELQMSAIQQ